jgi:DNA polymerase-1
MTSGGAIFPGPMPLPATPPTPQLFLVDGYALIYRAFFAMIARPLTTARGENTSAAWGVTNFILRLMERNDPRYLGWVLDVGRSFRHDTYAAYKATREKLAAEQQQDFDQSLARIRQLLDAFHIPILGLEGYEADDVIGTLVTQAGSQGVTAAIVSGDKDFYQLVAPGVMLLNPGRGGAAGVEEHWVDEHNAAERFGVAPERIVDYLALVGDSSDNVPGVRGVGEKTAVELLKAYGDLDTILARAAEVTGKRAREALQQHAAEARLSRELVTIRRDVPVSLDLPALRVRAPDVERLTQLFIELEFRSLIPRLERFREVEPASPAGAPAPTPAFPPATSAGAPAGPTVVDDARGLSAVVAACRAAEVIALRTETTNGAPLRGDLAGVALAVPGGRSWYLPFGHRAPDGELASGPPPVNLQPLGSEELRPLRDVLEDPAVPKAAHDAKHDLLVLRRAGVALGGVVYDSMLASFLLDPGSRSHALDVLARERLSLELRPYAAVVGTGKGERPFAEVPVADAARYGGAASDAVLRLRAAFATDLEDHRLRPLLDQIEIPLIAVLADMEWRGVLIDRELLAEIGRGFTRELGELERTLHRAAGGDFNILSTPQLRTVLFQKLQLPVLKRTKTGPSTDFEVLEQLAAMGHEVPRLLIEYRELSKLKSTYVDSLPGYLHPDTGRIHTSYNQVGASTGRLSSADPNLQNIPVRTERGEAIRRAFVAAPGSLLVVADYSQIELRLLAHLSEDPAFLDAFRRGGDIHRQTAAVIFGIDEAGVTADMRARAKTINFATIYGQGPFALSRQLGITQDEAREFIRQYFLRFAGVRAWLDRTVAEARTKGYVETLFGRRRYIPELKDRNFNTRAFGERTATNSPLQGSAADLIKIAMVRAHHRLQTQNLNARLILQVHDELVLEAPEAEVEAARSLVKREMEGAAELRVPLVVTVGAGRNWVEAKG